MSTLECPHHDLATKTEVDPQSRTTNEKLSAPQHDVSRDHGVDALRDINDQQAKTRNLPPEILSTIFELACPPIDFSDRFEDWYPGFDTFGAQDTFHFVLATVCHHWREVILSTPQLWTTITLRPNRHDRSIQNATALLNLYFERARALPISIELDFNGEEVEWHAERDEPVKVNKDYLARLEPLERAIFVDGASLIQHLSLIQVPTHWLPLVNENLSQCTSLALFDPMELIEVEDDVNEGKTERKRIDGGSDGAGDESEEGHDEESGEERDSDEDSDEDDDREDNTNNHEDDNYDFLLNLTKVPRLKCVDLVSVMDLDKISIPIGTIDWSTYRRLKITSRRGTVAQFKTQPAPPDFSTWRKVLTRVEQLSSKIIQYIIKQHQNKQVGHFSVKHHIHEPAAPLKNIEVHKATSARLATLARTKTKENKEEE